MGGSKKVLEISVACSSRLEARVECVREALAARGHRATLHTGAGAREALLSVDARSVRVLLLAERLDADKLQTLEHGLDPDRLGNLLVTTLDRSAPEMAERIESFARVAVQSRPRRPPVVRLVDPVPPTPRPKKWALPLAVACVVVVGVCVALQYGLRPGERPPPEPRPSLDDAHAEPAVAAPPSEAPIESEPVRISVELPVPDEEIEIFDITRPRTRREKKIVPEAAPAPTATPRDVAPLPSGPIAEAPALPPTPLALDPSPRSPRLPAPEEERASGL